MTPLVFTTDTEDYVTDDGEDHLDGVVWLDGHEVFRTEVPLSRDPHQPYEETVYKFASALRAVLT